MLLNEYLVKVLEESGCKAVFHVPGGAAFHLIDAISKSKKLELVPCFHEQACAIAAEAYYKTNSIVGVVLVTAGPGLSNISTGLLSAYVDRIPMIVLSGQAQSKYLINNDLRIYGPQAISAKKLFGNIANVLEVNSDITAAKIASFLKFYKTSEIGPKIIQIPLDLQKINLKFISKKFPPLLFIKNNFNNKKDLHISLDKAITSHKRPCLIIGGGLRTNEGISSLDNFSRNQNIPITLSWTAKDMLPNNDKNYCGLPGYFCNRAANATLYFSDLIIVIGSRLDPLQLGYQTKELLKDKTFFIIDTDEQELSKHSFNNSHKFLHDGSRALNILGNILNKKNLKYKQWTRLMHNAFLETQDEMVSKSTKKFVDPFNFVSTISALKANIFIAGSSGGSAEVSFLNFKVSRKQKFINSPGLGSMGFAIPSIIGALEGNKKASIVCVVGDGGLQMNIQELATLSRYTSRKLLVAVLNNRGYDSMRRSLKKYFGQAYFVDEDSGLNFPDLKHLSKSYGLNYKKISLNTNMQNQLKDIWSDIKSPTILEVFTRENVESFPKLSPVMNEDGSISSGSFIDCSPDKPGWYEDIENRILNFKNEHQ